MKLTLFTGFLCLLFISSVKAQFDSWTIGLLSGEAMESSSLIRVSMDSLIFSQDGMRHSVHLDSVIELNGNLVSRIYKGAFSGAMIGGLVGGWIFSESFRPQYNSGASASAEDTQTLTGGVIGLALGGMLGGLIGSLYSQTIYDLSHSTAPKKVSVISKHICFHDRLRSDILLFIPVMETATRTR